MKNHLYLESIQLINFVTFQNEMIHFRPGLNTIIGETGSGKSLIIDAILILVGLKNGKTFIRKDSNELTIEANFHTQDKSLLKSIDVVANTFSLKKIVSQDGKMKFFLNNQPYPLIKFKSLIKEHFNFVGQFENQKLLNSEYQLNLIDQMIDSTEEKLLYQKKFNLYISLKKEFLKVSEMAAQQERLTELLEFKIEEISKLSPSEEEETNLNEQKKIFLEKEKINEVTLKTLNLIDNSEEDSSILSKLTQVQTIINKNSALFSDKIQELATKILGQVNELSYILNLSMSGQEPIENLENILYKLDLYQKIKKKYSLTSSELKEQIKIWQSELDEIKNIQIKRNKLLTQIENEQQALYILANFIHEKRIAAAKTLSTEVTKNLHDLNMPESIFDAKIILNSTLLDTGLSSCSFLISANPGEGPHLLKDTASGGELIRVLLAINQVISKNSNTSILVFDEIDSSVDQKTARKIANALKKISEERQLITITHHQHLQEITNHLIIVQKEFIQENSQKRTKTFINEGTI